MAFSAFAFQPSGKAPLPNFDKRTDHAAAVQPLAPEFAAQVNEMKARVPHLDVETSKVLKTPSSFSARGGFLTGADGEGLSVLPATAQGIPKSDRHRGIKAFLNQHSQILGYGAEALSKNVRVTRDYTDAHNGLKTAVWRQELLGVPVFGAILKGHVTKNGELVNLHTDFVPSLNVAAVHGLKGRSAAAAVNAPGISAVDAIIIGARNIGDTVPANAVTARGPAEGASRKQTFMGAAGVKGDQYVELVWLPLNANAMRLGWQVIITSASRDEMFLLVIDSESGEVVVRRGLTSYISDATYRVYTSDSPSPFSPGHAVPSLVQPPLVQRSLVTTPALNVVASPDGWIPDGARETLGNNVDAHLDRNRDNAPDLPRPQGTTNRVFDFPLDLTQAPTTYGDAAVVQLFYWNNFMHDKLYELGFTEAAGNFQSNNFARGGLGRDAVQADAQDGSGTDNANFATPPDGFPPRMQMYVFTGSTPNRDGDLDAEVVLHEYGHGLSTRLVGGGVGIFELQTAGMGEGWSDFYGLSLLSEPTDPINGNWAAGGYVTYQLGGFANYENYYFGIRRYPYSTELLKNPLTFKDIDPLQASVHPGIPRSPLIGPSPAEEVHAQGEVWCIILWEVRANLINKYGQTNGNRIAMQLVTDGMKLSVPNPNFVQARDAILMADLVNNTNANYNELWRGFAKRGLGATATSPDSSTTIGVVESFEFPGLSISSTSSDDSATGNGNGAIDPNECVEVFVALKNNSVTNARSVTATLSTTTPGVTVVQAASAYPNIPAAATATNLTPFRIYTSPDFICGTRIQLTLISSSITTTQQLSTNRFELRSGLTSLNPALFNNNTALAIPDANTNGIDSTINVTGVVGALGKVTVSLYLTHTFDGDVTLELIGPDGTIVPLARNRGGSNDNFGASCTPFSARTTFDDNAPSSITFAPAPFLGAHRPEEPLSVFEGKSGAAVNGTWRLRVSDGFTGDVGTLQCWTLALHPKVCTDGGGACESDISVSAVASPQPGYANLNLNYAVSIANLRPISAMNVMLTNVLPPGVEFVSASSSQGTCTLVGGVIRCNLGTIAGAASANVSIVVRPTVLGLLTNLFVAGTAADSVASNNTATVVTSIVEPLPQFVTAGATLTAESYSPATGGIESGETVSVNLFLQNIGPIASGNLVATLLEGNGIASPSGPQNYGAIAPNSSGVANFTFTANGTPGSSISAILALQDGVKSLGTVAFAFTLGGEVTVENPNAITINVLGAATPYPSTLAVSGVQNVIGKVRVTFTKLSHSFPDDIDAMLVGPRGQRVVLMSDAGGSTALNNRTFTFDDAAGALPNETTILPGSYHPADYNSGTELGGDVFPAPAPVGTRASSLAAFNGTDPNGTWSLFIHDDAGNDAGSLGAWSLTINTVQPVNPVTDLEVTTSISPTPLAGEPYTITLNVHNYGPSNATSVLLTNIIPIGLESVSASSSQGAVFVNGDVLTANLGTITNGGSATVTMVLRANSTGLRTNSATVVSSGNDLNIANNVSTTAFVVGIPTADLTLKVVASPSPVFVSGNITYLATITNAGPNHAASVRFTNRLGAGLTFVSAASSQGSCSFAGGILECELDDLAATSNATVTLVATATTEGAISNFMAVDSFFRFNQVDDSTNVIVNVQPLAPLIVASGAALVSETPGSVNGTLDPGETVTLNFGLRNAGTAPTANLVATLLSSGGVSPITGAQNYGSLAADGPTAVRPFSFVVNGAPGSTLTASLQLQDGAQNLGTVTFNFAVSASRSFTNSNVIIIPNSGQANTYPSTLAVSGIAGSVSKVTVTIRQLTHTFPEDIDMLLVGPAGQKVMLMSDAGAGNGITGVTLTLDDVGGAIPFASPIGSGTYRPTDYGSGDTFPAPAPAGPYGTNLSAFNGSNPNGTWSLYIVDDIEGDAGRIDGGWELHIQTASPVVNSADVAIIASASGSVESGAPFTYNLTVVNYGPAVATGVTLANALPANFIASGGTISQGSFNLTASNVTANFGTLNVGASAVMTINGAAVGPRGLTNVFTVSASQSDPYLNNNSATVITSVAAPVLSIRRTGGNAVITWRSPSTGYTLESSLNATGAWSAAGLTVINSGGTNTATTPANGTKFFRLRK